MSRKIGLEYEKMALNYLKEKEYEEIDKNYYSRFGEIDLICKDLKKKELVFVEVKYRKNANYGSGIEYITKSKQKKLVITAKKYLKEKKLEDIPYRFDIISILGVKFKEEIEHIENAIWGDYL